jgi:O-antigen/teichoic acid export membrane protein
MRKDSVYKSKTAGLQGHSAPKSKSDIMACFRKQILRLIPTGKLASAVATLAGASTVAQVISIIAAPISTRLYTPQDYGTFAVFNSLLGLIVIIASLRYELAIPLASEDDRAVEILILCFSIILLFIVLTCGAIWWGSDWIASVTKDRSLTPWLWLLPVGVAGAGTYQALNYWTIRRQRYKELAQTKFTQSVTGTATMIGVGAAYPGPLGLLLSTLASQSVGIFLLLRDAAAVARASMTPFSLKGLLSVAYEYRQFPLFSSSAALMNSAASILPPLMLASLYGSEVTGWFGLAQKVMLLPLSLIGVAVGQVFLGEAAQVMREHPDSLPDLFKRITGRMLLFSIPIIVGGALSPLLFPIIFGSQWATAGIYAACISIYCAIQLIVSPISTIAILRKRQDIQFIFDALRAVMVALALWLPSFWDSTGIAAVISYSLVMSITYWFYYIAYKRIAKTGISLEKI